MNEQQKLQSIKNLKNITLSSTEKESILNRLKIKHNISGTTPEQNNTHILFSRRVYIWLKENSIATTLILFFVLTTTGRGMVATAYDSLPGDPLYYMKVSIIEPLKERSLKTIGEQVEYHAKLAVDRLIEAETLASNGRLGTVLGKEIGQLFSSHVAGFATALGEENAEVSPVVSESSRIRFEANVNAHAKLLELISASSPQMTVATDLSQLVRRETNTIKPFTRTDSIVTPFSTSTVMVFLARMSDVQKKIDTLRQLMSNYEAHSSLSGFEKSIMHETNLRVEAAEILLVDAKSNIEVGNANGVETSISNADEKITEGSILFRNGFHIADAPSN